METTSSFSFPYFNEFKFRSFLSSLQGYLQSDLLQTPGHGVSWMHIRFDEFLKYAAFPPYGNMNQMSLNQWYETIYILMMKNPAIGWSKIKSAFGFY
ncbi:DUF6940 family protein [Cyanothece sp. BG0011]|uniref:DUF6940 family protein n=1 Tax=Cyanothece sp. BG0011 TaxID=2082950 RepID=UPI00403F1163